MLSHPSGAPLLPKLRGHFAEFLNEGSLARLRILSLPTCVGLRCGHLQSSLGVFLASVGSATSVLKFPSHSPLGIDRGDLPPRSPYGLGRARPTARCAYPTVFPIADNGLRVVSEFPPIVHRLRCTPRLRSRLTLGGRTFPRKPQASGGQDSHLPSRLLIPAFSLPHAPQHLTVLLRCERNAPLPIRRDL